MSSAFALSTGLRGGLLEEGRLSVEGIAVACGYASAAALRHQFSRLRGTSLTSYRTAFRG